MGTTHDILNDITRIILALIGLGTVYLGIKIRQVHVLVNSNFNEVLQRLDQALSERDIATGERDEARQTMHRRESDK